MLRISEYVVESGDTLSAIALKIYGDEREYTNIAEYNNLKDANFIEVNQVLKLPNSRYITNYVVVPVKPTEQHLDNISNLFKTGFCDDRVAHDIYEAAITETIYLK